MNGTHEISTVFYLNKFLRKCEQDEVKYNDAIVSLETVLEFLTVETSFHLGFFSKRLILSFILLHSRVKLAISFYFCHAIFYNINLLRIFLK
jgi:hypothetical protein